MTVAAAPRNAIDIPPYVYQPLSDLDKKRQDEQREAWLAYRGKFRPPLKDAQGNPAKENVISNRCRPIVDKGVSFLFGQKVGIEMDKATQEVQDYIDGAWGDDDDKMTLLSKIAMNGAVCGMAFVRIMPNPDPERAPRIVNIDPMTVSVVTDPDDCEVVFAYLIEYQVRDGNKNTMTLRQAMWRVDPDGVATEDGGYDEDSTWVIQHFIRQGDGGEFQPNGDPISWLYPFPPIVECQNLPNPNEFWGLPDLPNELIDINNALNLSQSNTARIQKFHAHPKTYIIGAEATQISVAPDETIVLPEGATIGTLEMVSDLSTLMNFQANLRADMDEESRVPAVALGRMADLPKGQISGVALKTLYGPLLELTTLKQRLYGKLIREICRRIAAIGKKMAYDPYQKVLLHWADLLPTDDLQEAQTAAIWEGIGVSKATLMERGGFDPETEAEKTAQETADSMTRFAQGAFLPPAPNMPLSQNAPVSAPAGQQQPVGVGAE